MGHQGFRPLTSRNPHLPNPSRSVCQMCVRVCVHASDPSSIPWPPSSASPHVSSRRCRCTLPSTPADLQSAGLDLLCHAPSRDKATLDSDPWLRFNRFLIRLIYGSFFTSTITKKYIFRKTPSRCNTAQLVVSGECLAHTQPSCFMPSCACPARRRKCIGCDGVPLPSLPSLPRFSPATAHIFRPHSPVLAFSPLFSHMRNQAYLSYCPQTPAYLLVLCAAPS